MPIITRHLNVSSTMCGVMFSDLNIQPGNGVLSISKGLNCFVFFCFRRRLSDSHQRLAVFRSSVQNLKFSRAAAATSSSPSHSDVISGSVSSGGSPQNSAFSFNRRVISRRTDVNDYLQRRNDVLPRSPNRRKIKTKEVEKHPVYTVNHYPQNPVQFQLETDFTNSDGTSNSQSDSNTNKESKTCVENGEAKNPDESSDHSKNHDTSRIPENTSLKVNYDFETSASESLKNHVDMFTRTNNAKRIIEKATEFRYSPLSLEIEQPSLLYNGELGSDSNISISSFSSDKSPVVPIKMKISSRDFKETYQRPLNLNPPRSTSTPEVNGGEYTVGIEDVSSVSEADDSFLRPVITNNRSFEPINHLQNMNSDSDLSFSNSEPTSVSSLEEKNIVVQKKHREPVFYVRNNASSAESSGDDGLDELSDIGIISDPDDSQQHIARSQGPSLLLEQLNQNGRQQWSNGVGSTEPLYVSKSLLLSRQLRYECTLPVIQELEEDSDDEGVIIEVSIN